MAAKTQRLSRIEPELLEILHEINTQRMLENQRNASVTIEDFEETPVEPAADSAPDQPEQDGSK